MNNWPIYLLLGVIAALLWEISNKLSELKKIIGDLTGWLKLGLIPPINEYWQGTSSYLPVLKPIAEELRAIRKILEGKPSDE